MANEVTPIPPEDLGRIQDFSEALFGAKHRLPMAVVIADAPAKEIYAKSLAGAAGTTEVQAGVELRHFERAGMLELLPQGPRKKSQRGRLPKRYCRRRSHFWTLARKLAEES